MLSVLIKLIQGKLGLESEPFSELDSEHEKFMEVLKR